MSGKNQDSPASTGRSDKLMRLESAAQRALRNVISAHGLKGGEDLEGFPDRRQYSEYTFHRIKDIDWNFFFRKGVGKGI
jgi:hypothetical protein